MDVPCSQRQEQVSGFQRVADGVVGYAQVGKVTGFHGAVPVHGVDDRLPAYPFNRQFAGGIHVRYENEVRLLEHLAEVIRQKLRARVAVRLEVNYQAVRLEGTGSLERGGYFRWVVAVVVHNPDGGGKVFGFKAPFGSRKGGQAPHHRREIHAQFRCQSNRGQGIQDIVASGYAQLHAAQFLFPLQHGEQGASAAFQHVRSGVVRIGPAVGNGIGVLGADILSAGMRAAINNLAARLGAKPVEHGLDFIQILVVVQVFRFNVEDDAVLRNVIYQRAVAFIPFRHQVFAVFIPVGVGSQHGDFRPHVVARTHAAFPHQVRAEG